MASKAPLIKMLEENPKEREAALLFADSKIIENETDWLKIFWEHFYKLVEEKNGL